MHRWRFVRAQWAWPSAHVRALGPGASGCLRLNWASKERNKAAGRVVFTVGET